MSVEDHFSAHADCYARARPGYPAVLFEWLASAAPGRDLAWDVGCGSGQASRALARHFQKVVATDPSAEQIARAAADPRIEYRAEAAESSSLAAASTDLVTVAQALHWFDIERFLSEAARVLRPRGVVAAWTYQRCRVDAAVDAVFEQLYEGVLGPYWPPQRRLVEDGYRSLTFPFETLAAPPLSMSVKWTLAQYLDYLRSWSASQRYLRVHGRDPLQSVAAAMAAAWGSPDDPREVSWPLSVRASRKP